MKLIDIYNEWLFSLVTDSKRLTDTTYRKLLNQLNSIEFIYFMEMDGNRYEDAISFRYRFGHERGYSPDTIKQQIDIKPPSVLEVMISLSWAIEEEIMDDERYGNRVAQWFWITVSSLGLSHQTDDNYDFEYVDEVINTFLSRNYDYHGKGSLFEVEYPHADMRHVDLWTQAMWYLNQLIETQEIV